jgi:hypothetical protein
MTNSLETVHNFTSPLQPSIFMTDNPNSAVYVSKIAHNIVATRVPPALGPVSKHEFPHHEKYNQYIMANIQLTKSRLKPFERGQP